MTSAADKSTRALHEWFNVKGHPFTIAGPCSAESEEQVFETSRQLVESGKVSVIRAGVWKPRTRPDSFEGIGPNALPWLQRVQSELNVPVATEVANARHVEHCLKAGIDVLWLGARTTVNPFYVQEISESLKGVDVPVLVKNPIHADLGLWMGAIERLEKAGVKRIAAIHRGFFAENSAPFRNEPKWEMSFALRAKAPEIPIICDPSHIAGARDLVEQVSQTAMDINLDGLMVESHITPDKALSDAAQQVTPASLSAMIDRLIIRSAEPRNEEAHSQLDALRNSIDEIDEDIVELLFKRMDVVDTIGKVKVENDISIFQMDRWFEILAKRGLQGKNLNLSPALIQELFQIIHKYSVERQNESFNKKD
ncbi:chorismate mutase [Phaeocystidibacter luteus]|uniref:chorismate mutase n=1 Tax=Phaeocystidibacter luteus TaxID=911197 RepID=A0A6N6RI71_9FLAO|nr:chorismate mutase [Phaeocystidibacter luteus]KAB2814025.1 bifunctional 3-deoxy-7-phosphoheptulonate synthase/chorismate mutase type II [Phaeocystidibacter luteus]